MSHLTFEYKAIDRTGAESSGLLEAATRQDAYRRLLSTGMTPLRIRVASSAKNGFRLMKGRRGVKPSQIAHFTYQLSVLLEARLPVTECFRSIAEQEPCERFAAMIRDIGARVESGSNITESMEAYADVFGSVYVETIRAAERTGNMIEVLGHLAEMVEEQEEMKRIVRSALMYPLLVVVALGLAVLFLLVFVVPRFAMMFVERGVELPLLTRMLMSVGGSIQHYWWGYLAAVGLAWFAMRRAWRHPGGRIRIDTLLNRVPYLNQILQGLGISRFASVFGISLGSGIGLIDSLEMGGRASGRPLLLNDIRLMVEQVSRGGRMTGVLKSCVYLPGFVKQLLSAGEESAELTKMCRIIARHYGRETKHMAKNAATVIEPVLIAGLTFVVLIVALAIFLPMWDMMSLVG